tara:strand:- start:2265 stop:3833 length:1569 start_codon:yes stop_codon:yes gene_type:complete
MSIKEYENMDLDSMADDLSGIAPPAPTVPVSNILTSATPSIDDTLRSKESALLRLDRLLVSGGARLVLFLPLMAIVLLGAAQSYGSNDTEWWNDTLREAAGGFSLVRTTYATALLILIADIFLLTILLRMMTYSRTIFHYEADALTSSGLTFRSSHGYAEMRATLDGSIRQVTAISSLIAISSILLALSLWFPSSQEEVSPVLLALSTGSLLAGYGVQLISIRSRFNASEPWGMLEAFSPPIHPALLTRPFNDVIKAHIDPLLGIRITEYLKTVRSELKEGYTMSELQESLLLLLHLRRSSLISDSEFRKNLELMVEPTAIDGLFRHPEVGEETWDRLLQHARSECKPFFRLHDRMRMRRGISSSDGGFWFDVDMENLVVGQANLFAFILNSGDEPKDLVLKIQTPDFKPNECVYKLHSSPLVSSSDPLNPSSLSSMVQEMTNSTSIVWQSLLPSIKGEATVTVRLEDDSGNLISGRVLNVQVGSDLITRTRRTVGAMFMIGALIAITSPLLPLAGSVLGLL